jgi:hypothetical protein
MADAIVLLKKPLAEQRDIPPRWKPGAALRALTGIQMRQVIPALPALVRHLARGVG